MCSQLSLGIVSRFATRSAKRQSASNKYVVLLFQQGGQMVDVSKQLAVLKG